MPERPKAWLAWSSGKDSAWALHAVQRAGDFDIVAMMTTINCSYSRVAMHGVREELVEMQAGAAGLSLVKVPIPAQCRNEDYEQAMSEAMARAKAERVTHLVFGDLFLEDIRAYREKQLASCGMKGVFPLWRRDTAQLAHEMLAGGLVAHVVCVDPAKLDRSFAGRRFDNDFLKSLSPSVDPCGENGEFHSFASDGPMFRQRVLVDAGEVVERDGFVFADLFPSRHAVAEAVLHSGE